ncbi:MAG: electron transfer flavoprotein-ubiquinone oxidoreductase [Planctomycetes bacterium]|nr:electron transfer flavoprotein-ubiquinone oxidoreductase [Planctomycetota bacterium]
MSDPRPISLNAADVERDELEVDVLIVGAGPAGLSCAIDLARRFKAAGEDERVILVLDKATEVGHHTLSGAVMNPKGISELFSDWRERGFPVQADVSGDSVHHLREGGGSFAVKGAMVPPQFKNHGNCIVSLNQVVGWLQAQAEELGVEVYAGFPAAEVRYEGDRVVGVVTRDSGLAKDGTKKPTFEAGMEVRAQVTVFAEGTRGNLAKELFQRLDLYQGKNPQTWGTGCKEVWEVPEEIGRELNGTVQHTAGYPLGNTGYGGGWIYGIDDTHVSIGFVVGLDHPDAALDPHALFVQWKQHKHLQEIIKSGKVVRYGAKTVPEGGYHSMPRLSGDGFCLVGDTAGFLNAATLKGIHLAVKSGLLAAEAITPAVCAEDTGADALSKYTELFEASWAKEELYKVRNWRQAFAGGMLAGMVDAGFQMLTGGRGLVAKREGHADHETMRPVAESRMEKPQYDDACAMDKLTDVYHSGTEHEEDQPSHLLVVDPSICVDRCTSEYGNPCQHFCPAAVYEWPEAATEVVVNFSNCVHCKTCDIADPYENIEWVVPEGGGGPRYIDM